MKSPVAPTGTETGLILSTNDACRGRTKKNPPSAATLSLAQGFRMTDGEAETTFKMIRWADTNGAPVCPSCGSVEAYEAGRPNDALRFRCKGYKKDFTITSGTLFASQKLPCGAIWRPSPSATK